MVRIIRVLCLMLLGGIAAGCSAGAHAGLPAGSAAFPQGMGRVTFGIDKPQNAATSNKRSAQYISPATTQMSINVEQSGTSIAGYPVSVALTSTSNGCTSTLANTYCQLTIALAPGTYTAILTTEDANGTPLSLGQTVPFTIVAGANNTIPMVLSGIPHALQIAGGAGAVHGSANAGFTLYGATAQALIVTALDADGNIIVGPGAPSYGASVLSGSGWSAAAPASTTPNTIAITPPGTNGAGATFAMTATYPDATCSQSGAVCTATFTIKNDIQTLFVTNYYSNSVTAYTQPFTGAAVTISDLVNSAGALLLNPAGDIFVLNQGNATVTEYAPPFIGAPVATISSGLSHPVGMALDAAGNLFVVNNSPASVVEYAPPYTAGPEATITNGLSVPYTAVIDASGNLFVRNVGNNSVTEYTPPGYALSTTVTSGIYVPESMIVTPAGELFVSNYGNYTVTAYAPPYTGAPVTISSGLDYPAGLAADAAGDVFVANIVSNTVTEYAPPYTGAPVATISAGVNNPQGLAIDGAGNLLVASFLANTVDEYAPPYTGSPTLITSGVNGPGALLLTP